MSAAPNTTPSTGTHSYTREAILMANYLFTPSLCVRGLQAIESIADEWCVHTDTPAFQWEPGNPTNTTGYLRPTEKGNLTVASTKNPDPIIMGATGFGLAATLQAIIKVSGNLQPEDSRMEIPEYLYQRYKEVREIALGHPAAVDIVKMTD